MVFNSWETAPYLANIRHKFDRLWDKKEKNWIAMPIPEAVKLELLTYRPAWAPTVEYPWGAGGRRPGHRDPARWPRRRPTGADHLSVPSGRALAAERRPPGHRHLHGEALAAPEPGAFCRVAEGRVGAVAWDQIRTLPRSRNAETVIRQLDGQALGVLRQLAGRHTPLHRHVFRDTRPVLRKYRELGLLKENIPRANLGPSGSR